jgi:hypothetical protein
MLALRQIETIVPHVRKKTGLMAGLGARDPFRASAQTCDVVRHRFDFAVVELGSDLGHGQVILAHTIAKSAELCRGLVGM